jgi:hypothetical protein
MSADDDGLIDALYAEWLMAQPEAMVTSGDVLVQRMESQWGYEDFLMQLPDQITSNLKSATGGELTHD